MTFQSPGNPDFGQNSGHFSVPKGPNVKSAKLLIKPGPFGLHEMYREEKLPVTQKMTPSPHC